LAIQATRICPDSSASRHSFPHPSEALADETFPTGEQPAAALLHPAFSLVCQLGMAAALSVVILMKH
jgi:hypothetical protein